MKTSKAAIAALAVLLCGILATESAYAWGRGRGFYGAPFIAGALVGGALFAGSRYYYPPYYPPYYAPYAPYSPYSPYYPAAVAPAPSVYVEQGGQPQFQQQQQQQGYWYYCAGSRAYYPYVKECPAGWQRVAPQPG
jgi:hypothetical protein